MLRFYKRYKEAWLQLEDKTELDLSLLKVHYECKHEYLKSLTKLVSYSAGAMIIILGFYLQTPLAISISIIVAAGLFSLVLNLYIDSKRKEAFVYKEVADMLIKTPGKQERKEFLEVLEGRV